MTTLREVPHDDSPDKVSDATPARDSENPEGVDMWIMPYLRDSTLWPVLIVLIVHVAAFITPVLLYAVRDQRAGPIVALAVVVLLTLRGFRWEIQSRKKFGAISWLIVTTWITSGIAAYFANIYDFL